MNSFKKNQKGFSAIEGLLILVIVVIVGGTAFYVYHASKNTNNIYNAAIQSSTPKTKLHTTDEAVYFTQKTYTDFLAAVNNAGTNDTEPLGLIGLAAVKDNLTPDFYAKASASQNGSAFSCAAQFVPDKYMSALASATKSTAIVAVAILNGPIGSNLNKGMTVTVDLASLKISAVNCPN